MTMADNKLCVACDNDAKCFCAVCGDSLCYMCAEAHGCLVLCGVCCGRIVSVLEKDAKIKESDDGND